MPKPHADESKQAYLSRFMASPEARRDYPDESQRAAVAYSLWEHRNVLQNAAEWPRMFSARYIEPGLVHYADAGTLLVQKPALDRMAKSFVGKPVINEVHKEVSPEQFREQADGAVTRVWYNAEDGWYWLDFLVWDAASVQNCMSNAYSVSCAYRPTEMKPEKGSYHNLPYEEEILNGEYTHLAIVSNPRYEGARIIANSKEASPTMKLKFWKKDVKNAAELDAEKATVDVDGSAVTFTALLNAYKKDEEAKKALADRENYGGMSDDTMIEVDGKEMPLKNLKDIYRTHKNAEDEAEKKRKEDEEKKNAEEKEKKEKEEKEAAEKKNAADEAARKAAETKSPEDKKSFDDLRNAAGKRGEPQQIEIRTSRQLAEEGRKRYGSEEPKK